MGELIVIAIIALLFLGPEKLPDAAKSISKGIRDFRKQTRELQQIVEDDSEIGGAIRDLKSALRGDEPSPAEARRRRSVEAARKAAENAARVDADMREPSDELQGPRTQRVTAGDQGQADPTRNADDSPADEDVATVIERRLREAAAREAPDEQIPDEQIPDEQIPDEQIPDEQIPAAGGDVNVPTLRQPESSIPRLPYTPRPLFADGSDTDDDSAPGDGTDSSESADRG